MASEQEPLLIPDTEAAALCGIARATWHRLRAAGKVGPVPVRLGRAVRYRRDEVPLTLFPGGDIMSS
jgi:predicted DNA-binding transcriptional regulator AlpA